MYLLLKPVRWPFEICFLLFLFHMASFSISVSLLAYLSSLLLWSYCILIFGVRAFSNLFLVKTLIPASAWNAKHWNDNKWKKKCVNNSSKISFLGYTISKEGISPDQILIEKIPKLATPSNKKELQSFLELVNFYRRYVPEYTDLTEPFANLRKNNVEFIWSEK